MRVNWESHVYSLTFKSLSFQNLATGLMLKLVVLAQAVVTERAAEDATSCNAEDFVICLGVLEETILTFLSFFLLLRWLRFSVEIHTVLPHAAVTFDTVCISQWTGTGVRAQTLLSVAHPGLAEVTYRPLVATKKDDSTGVIIFHTKTYST